MAVTERSGIAVGLKRGHVSIKRISVPPQDLPDLSSSPWSKSSWSRNHHKCAGFPWLMLKGRKSENRTPRVETAHFTYQGSSKQADGFREGDCQRGCRVGVSGAFEPGGISMCSGLILLLVFILSSWIQIAELYDIGIRDPENGHTLRTLEGFHGARAPRILISADDSFCLISSAQLVPKELFLNFALNLSGSKRLLTRFPYLASPPTSAESSNSFATAKTSARAN